MENIDVSIRVRENGEAVATLPATPKIFSTGSRGFRVNGKVVLGGKRYQVGANLVEIGSKPKA